MPRPRRDTAVQSAEERMENAFWTTLKEKPYAKITVTEIVRVAKVNRNSFYYHYGSVAKLAEESIKHTLANNPILLGIAEESPELTWRKHLLDMMNDPKQVERLDRIALVAGEHGTQQLRVVLHQEARALMVRAMNLDPDHLDLSTDMILDFTGGGMLTLMKHWLQFSKMPEFPQELHNKNLAVLAMGMYLATSQRNVVNYWKRIFNYNEPDAALIGSNSAATGNTAASASTTPAATTTTKATVNTAAATAATAATTATASASKTATTGTAASAATKTATPTAKPLASEHVSTVKRSAASAPSAQSTQSAPAARTPDTRTMSDIHYTRQHHIISTPALRHANPAPTARQLRRVATPAAASAAASTSTSTSAQRALQTQSQHQSQRATQRQPLERQLRQSYGQQASQSSWQQAPRSAQAPRAAAMPPVAAAAPAMPQRRATRSFSPIFSDAFNDSSAAEAQNYAASNDSRAYRDEDRVQSRNAYRGDERADYRDERSNEHSSADAYGMNNDVYERAGERIDGRNAAYRESASPRMSDDYQRGQYQPDPREQYERGYQQDAYQRYDAEPYAMDNARDEALAPRAARGRGGYRDDAYAPAQAPAPTSASAPASVSNNYPPRRRITRDPAFDTRAIDRQSARQRAQREAQPLDADDYAALRGMRNANSSANNSANNGAANGAARQQRRTNRRPIIRVSRLEEERPGAQSLPEQYAEAYDDYRAYQALRQDRQERQDRSGGSQQPRSRFSR